MSLLTHPYAQLIRADKPVGTLLLMFPCWWGVLAHSAIIPWGMLVLFAVGAFAMRSAGCVLNDIADREIDAQVARTAMRPLASGVLTLREAYGILAALLLMALGVALALGWPIVLLGLCWLPLVVAYPYMKRITFWPQAFLGITFGAGPLFGTLTVTGTITITGILLYIAAIVWTIGYDTIYACQDIEDDQKVGVKSTARLFGNTIRYWVGSLYAFAFCCLVSGYAMSDSAVFGYVMILLAGCGLVWQVVSLQPDHPTTCLRLFKSNVWIGLLIALAYL